MNNLVIEKILFGEWRPWIADGAELMQEESCKSVSGSKPSVDLLNMVQAPAPFDRASLEYKQLIEYNLLSWYSIILEKIEQRKREVDQKYIFVNAVKELETKVKNIPVVESGIAESTTEEKYSLTEYVLEIISLNCINLLVDLHLRNGHLARDFHYTVSEAYLKLLNKPVPEPSPFSRTIHWFKKEVKNQLKMLSREHKNARPRELGTSDLIREIADKLRTAENSSKDYQNYQRLIHHLENAWFLVKSNASFLKNDSEQLLGADYCREWIQAMKYDIMLHSESSDLIEELKKLDKVRSWFDENFLQVKRTTDGYIESEACKWIGELSEMIDPVVETEPARRITTGESDKEVKINHNESFTGFFRSRFVHKNDVETAFGVDRKTLKSYMDLGDKEISILKLKSNIWYLREDLEDFLEEMTG